MELQQLVNSELWREVEQKMSEKMTALLLDIDKSKPSDQLAIEILANHKAYGILKDFLEDMGFYRGHSQPGPKRSYS